jgi:hypothetical protein
MSNKAFAGVLLLLALSWTAPAVAQDCVACHKDVTPRIVADWDVSKHSENGISCDFCHGAKHTSAEDVAEVLLPTPETCGQCHAERVKQFKQGKHSLAWVAATQMPTTHFQPMALLQGKQGCTGCHKIGLKTEAEAKELNAQGFRYGGAACDSCHTRHAFSVKEASQPQACRTCHMGIDHPQWEMYSSSKHGVRFLLQQIGTLPAQVAAPTCQTCHMQEGNHGVRTAWGFLAVRLPMPEDKKWADDRATLLMGMGVLSPEGEPTPRLELVKKGDMARLTEDEFRLERQRMLTACTQCHSRSFAVNQLQQGDEMVRESDRLLAEAIRIVAGLYQDGLLEKPEHFSSNYPDLLAFQDVGSDIERELFLMFLQHRMRTFQGAFHINPDYTFWYGWSEMVRDLDSIRDKAEELRNKIAPARAKSTSAGGK